MWNCFLVADAEVIASLDSATPFLWAVETEFVLEDSAEALQALRISDPNCVTEGSLYYQPEYVGHFKVLLRSVFADLYELVYEMFPTERLPPICGAEFFGHLGELVPGGHMISDSKAEMMRSRCGWALAYRSG